jgi:hypothetical protein
MGRCASSRSALRAGQGWVQETRMAWYLIFCDRFRVRRPIRIWDVHIGIGDDPIRERGREVAALCNQRNGHCQDRSHIMSAIMGRAMVIENPSWFDWSKVLSIFCQGAHCLSVLGGEERHRGQLVVDGWSAGRVQNAIQSVNAFQRARNHLSIGRCRADRCLHSCVLLETIL